MPAIDPNNPTGSASMAHMSENTGGMRQTHTGVNNSYGGRKAGLECSQVQLSYGVYKTRLPALNLQYHGFDDSRECEHAFKALVTIPEKWLKTPTTVATLKAFFLKSYRKKFPDAPLSLAAEDKVQLTVKDMSMFVFSKEAVKDDAIVSKIFYDRQDVWAMLPSDWAAMDAELKLYRRTIVRYLAHCHRSSTDSWEAVVPVTSSRQLAPTNCYVVFTGWYKLQCVIVKPELTIADLKVYLHEKNGSRMPLECIDIGLRSGDDIKIIDDALTLQQVYEKTEDPNASYTDGPGTFGEYEKHEEQLRADAKEAARVKELEQKAEAEIERNKDKRGPDAKYFARHTTTSRVHAEWDDPDADIKTFAIDDQPHTAALAATSDLSDVIGPQMPMHLRKTHKEKDSKYAGTAASPQPPISTATSPALLPIDPIPSERRGARLHRYAHLVNEDGAIPYLTAEGAYAERPMIKDTAEEAARVAALAPTFADSEGKPLFGPGAPPQQPGLQPQLPSAPTLTAEQIGPTPYAANYGARDGAESRVVDITDSVAVEDVPEEKPLRQAAAAAETLAGLEPEEHVSHDATPSSAPPPPPPPAPTTTLKAALPSFTGKTLVLGVGKRIQDEKHKIWVATIHDPYSFRGPEDRASGGGQKDDLALQQNGAPKGWSAPAVGEASVNQDENCCIM